MYFNAFPTIKYYFDDDTKQTLATHITRRASFVREVISNIDVYDEYFIAEGEFPETVANRVYGNSFYHWIILLFNDIIDPYEQWPKSTDTLVKYSSRKYGEANLYSIHHYEDNNGNWLQAGTAEQSVSNLEYETQLNELKRKIKIPRKEYIAQIINEHAKVLEDV